MVICRDVRMGAWLLETRATRKAGGAVRTRLFAESEVFSAFFFLPIGANSELQSSVTAGEGLHVQVRSEHTFSCLFVMDTP